MSLSSSQLNNTNVIQPLPRFRTIRFGRDCHRMENEDNDYGYKTVETLQPSVLSEDSDRSSSILITGIRQRDWQCYDDSRIMDQNIPNVKYRLIPSVNNTIKNRCHTIDKNTSHYEEYDLDEQDIQWLTAYNQFRIEKDLPELDENIFEYIMQLLEYQCLLAIRRENYEDTIQCDACRRIDDVNDLIQCTRCKMFVHKKCYGLDTIENPWMCDSCQVDSEHHHQCSLCGKGEGALKRMISTTQEWVHLSCAFWFSQIEFDTKMTPILNDILSCDGRCSLCYKTNGVKMNCCWKNCQYRFHPRCAMIAGQDMLVAESDNENLIRLLALCSRHTEKLDAQERQTRTAKHFEIKQKRFVQFASYIDLNSIKKETEILPDVIESVHAYWLLKRQTNNGQPLIDLPEAAFNHEFDGKIDLVEFRRRYHLEHSNPIVNHDDEPNVLQFLATNSTMISNLSMNNFFVKCARHIRRAFIDYERSQFCFLDIDRKREGQMKSHF